MTTEETSFGVMAPDGTRLGGISAEGNVSGVAGAFQEDVTVAGELLLGTLAEGGEDPGWLDRLPRGVINGNDRTAPSTLVGDTGVQYAFLHTSAHLLPGRRYRICGSVRARLHASNAALSIFLRHREGTETPSITDPVVGVHSAYGTGVSNSANHRLVAYGEAFYTVDSPRMESFLITYRGDYGGTPQRDSGYIYVEDVGPDFADSGGSGDDGGRGNKVTYTTTWQASASRMYNRFGTMLPGRDGDVDLWYWHGELLDYQSCGILFGAGASGSTGGDEVGKTLPQALDGAQIERVEVYLRNKVWHNSPVNFAMNALGASALPASRQVDNTGGRVWEQRNYASGAGSWWRIAPGATWFANGSNRGVTLGDFRGSRNIGGINYELTSAAFHGINDADPPLLRITYTR